MAGIVGILGVIPFVAGQGSMNTVKSLTKKRKNAFAKHRVINSGDLIEDTGFDPIDIELDIQLFKPWTMDPAASIAGYEALMDSKIPVPLIVGNTPVGRGLLTLWVIEEMDIQGKKWTGGALTLADIKLRLIEYSNPFGTLGPFGPLVSLGVTGVIGSLI
jgi:Phage P2 GpU